MDFFVLMIRRPPRSTLTDTILPYTTLFRSHDDSDVADRSAESARLLGKPSTQDPLLGEFGPECHASRSGSRKTLAPGLEFIFGVQQPLEQDRKSTRLNSSH